MIRNQDRHVRGAVQLRGLLQLLGQGGHVRGDDEHVGDRYARGQDHYPEAVDQAQGLDQQVEGHQAAAEVHREHHQEAEEVAPRDGLCKGVGHQHREHHVVDRAHDRQLDRVAHGLEQQRRVEHELIALPGDLRRPEHEGIARVLRLRHDGDQDRVVEGIDDHQPQDRQHDQQRDVKGVDLLDLVFALGLGRRDALCGFHVVSSSPHMMPSPPAALEASSRPG